VLQRQEEERTLGEALRSLPETERIVVTLFYFGQHSYQEIAQFVEMPISTVKSRLFTARRRLKERLRTQLKERMVAMVEETLEGQRPSRDDRFETAVIDLLRAAGRGDEARVRTLLESDTKLNAPHDDPEHGPPMSARCTMRRRQGIAMWRSHCWIMGPTSMCRRGHMG
jgi:DNA-directed RNA polymerase specialized sigma subunit